MSLSYPLSNSLFDSFDINKTKVYVPNDNNNQQINDPFGLYVDGRNKKKIKKEYSVIMEHQGKFCFQRVNIYGDIT